MEVIDVDELDEGNLFAAGKDKLRKAELSCAALGPKFNNITLNQIK